MQELYTSNSLPASSVHWLFIKPCDNIVTRFHWLLLIPCGISICILKTLLSACSCSKSLNHRQRLLLYSADLYTTGQSRPFIVFKLCAKIISKLHFWQPTNIFCVFFLISLQHRAAHWALHSLCILGLIITFNKYNMISVITSTLTQTMMMMM